MIVVLNPKGEIICAPGIIRMVLGYESRELIGRSAFRLLPYNLQRDMKLRFEWIVACGSLTINAVLPVKHKAGFVLRLKVTVCNFLHVENVRGVVIMTRT